MGRAGRRHRRLLVADLLLVHRTAHVITIKEASIESAIWISIGLLFGVVMIVWQGGQAGGEYYAGFLIEKSLSVDNVFVWAVILSFFRVPREYQFRVLFWGIFGALVLRGDVHLRRRLAHRTLRLGPLHLRRVPAVHRGQDRPSRRDQAGRLQQQHRHAARPTARADHRRVRRPKAVHPQNAKRVATPLFTVLILIEATDVVFAVDSVPAILAVSREPFIVFASNAFAILGLRSLYFLLGGMQGKFRYLNIGLGVILAFVGIKMLLIGEPFEVHLPTYVSLSVIALVLTVAIVASLRADRRDRAAGITPPHELRGRGRDRRSKSRVASTPTASSPPPMSSHGDSGISGAGRFAPEPSGVQTQLPACGAVPRGCAQVGHGPAGRGRHA